MNKAGIEVSKRWLSLCKPLRSLGVLELWHQRLAQIQGTMHPSIEKPVAVVFAADHGLVKEKVSQCGQEVTAQVFQNMSKGESCVAIFARHYHAPLVLVDMGIACPYEIDPAFDGALWTCSLGPGTASILDGPAMRMDQAEAAIAEGRRMARHLHDKGHRYMVCGEMGIGNSSSAVLLIAKLLDLPVAPTRGAGLSDEAFAHKQKLLRELCEAYSGPMDPMHIGASFGGFELLAMAGFDMELAALGQAVFLDGLLSYAAALLAVRLMPSVRDALMPTHRPLGEAARQVEAFLDLDPRLNLDLALGEGAGAFSLYPLLQMAILAYEGLPAFEAGGVVAYEDHGHA